MKVFQIESQYYMDTVPSYSLMVFASQTDADMYVDHMRSTWNEGIMQDAKMLTKEEVIALSSSPIWKHKEKEVLNLLNECDY